ncbi:DUF4232 domain-containing protein [Nocardioides panaciterrulae]|uniref:DUF4232 domain-containing protein n=1 Tax=Nocardioides panaciterrulae TaxID=661492 RepID=A0A7Y9E8W3_9ACTN|nr:hypothetical protein [Nocardioides panaciterrulae]
MKLIKMAGALAVAGLVVAGLVTPAGAAQARPAECTNAELTASYHRTDAGMNHVYGRIVLRNTSDHACTVRGYGGLSFVGHGDGTQIGAAAQRTPSRVRTIVVRPGQRVVSEVAQGRTAPYPKRRCHPTHVDGFRVYLPDETRAQYVPHPTRGCRNPHVHLLAHQAYRRP